MTVYEELLKESDRLKMPIIYFKTDLTIYDQSFLKSDNAPKVFGYIIRKTGTHFLHVPIDTEDIELNKTKLKIGMEFSGKFYNYNGTDLKKVHAKTLQKLYC